MESDMLKILLQKRKRGMLFKLLSMANGLIVILSIKLQALMVLGHLMIYISVHILLTETMRMVRFSLILTKWISDWYELVAHATKRRMKWRNVKYLSPLSALWSCWLQAEFTWTFSPMKIFVTWDSHPCELCRMDFLLWLQKRWILGIGAR